MVSHTFLCLFKAHEKYKSGHLKKMENPFVDEENIPLTQDEDYDNYSTLDMMPGRVDETLFTVPDTTEATSTFRLRQKLKRDKIVSL